MSLSAAGGLALAVVPQLEPWLGWRAPVRIDARRARNSGGRTPARPVRCAPGQATARDGGRRSERPARSAPVPPLRRLHGVVRARPSSSATGSSRCSTRAAGYSQGTAGLVGSLILAGGIVSRPLGGWLARRYPGHLRPILGSAFVAERHRNRAPGARRPGCALARRCARARARGRDPVRRVVRGRNAHPARRSGRRGGGREHVGEPRSSSPERRSSGSPSRCPATARSASRPRSRLWLGALAVLPLIRELDPVPERGLASAR